MVASGVQPSYQGDAMRLMLLHLSLPLKLFVGFILVKLKLHRLAYRTLPMLPWCDCTDAVDIDGVG